MDMEYFIKIRDCVAIFVVYYQVKKLFRIGGAK